MPRIFYIVFILYVSNIFKVYLFLITSNEGPMSCLFYLVWYLQILLESIPISSSGHVTLVQHWVYTHSNQQIMSICTELEHLMHMPTILVLTLFLVRNYNFTLMPALVPLGIMLMLANIATVLVYLVYTRLNIKNKFPLWLGFLFTACILGSLLYWPCVSPSAVMFSYTHALIIGLAQGLALLPGVSRLALTFVIACWLGYSCEQAFVFSCALQLPLITVAVLRALYTYSCARFKQLMHGRIITLVLVTVLSYSVLELVYSAACAHILGYLSIVLLGSAFYAFVRRTSIKKFLARAC
jgi:undecaprenyl-diphosphatase